MKKVVKFLSYAFLGSFLVVSSAFASGDKANSVKTSENSIREQLANALSKLSVEDASEVYVYFTVSSKSGFELENVAGLDSKLATDVKATLKAKSIAVPADLNGRFLIKVSFINK